MMAHIVSQPPVWITSYVEALTILALGSILAGAFAAYKQHNCKGRWWCPFIAKHAVHGTTSSVCPIHHTAENHERLQARHKRKHPGRLAHGESPGLEKPAPAKPKPPARRRPKP
jgi:hypothetical protein